MYIKRNKYKLRVKASFRDHQIYRECNISRWTASGRASRHHGCTEWRTAKGRKRVCTSSRPGLCYMVDPTCLTALKQASCSIHSRHCQHLRKET